MTARLNSTLRHWRRPIIQRMIECPADVVIPPYLPPTAVLSATIRVEDIVSKQETGILTFTVLWEAPSNLNGDLSFYELCLGPEAVSVEEDNCTSPSTSLCVAEPEAVPTSNNCTPLELDPSDPLVTEIEYMINPESSGV